MATRTSTTKTVTPETTKTVEERVQDFLKSLDVSSVGSVMVKTKDTKNTKRYDVSSPESPLDCIYVPLSDVRHLGSPHKVMVIVVNIDGDPD